MCYCRNVACEKFVYNGENLYSTVLTIISKNKKKSLVLGCCLNYNKSGHRLQLDVWGKSGFKANVNEETMSEWTVWPAK